MHMFEDPIDSVSYDSAPLRKTRHFTRATLPADADLRSTQPLLDSGIGTFASRADPYLPSDGWPLGRPNSSSGDMAPRKISHLFTTPNYFGFSIVGNDEAALTLVPAIPHKKPVASHPTKKGTESHTAASPNVIRTDDWRRANNLILQQLGPPPKVTKKLPPPEDAVLNEETKQKKTSVSTRRSKPRVKTTDTSATVPPAPPSSASTSKAEADREAVRRYMLGKREKLKRELAAQKTHQNKRKYPNAPQKVTSQSSRSVSASAVSHGETASGTAPQPSEHVAAPVLPGRPTPEVASSAVQHAPATISTSTDAPPHHTKQTLHNTSAVPDGETASGTAPQPSEHVAAPVLLGRPTPEVASFAVQHAPATISTSTDAPPHHTKQTLHNTSAEGFQDHQEDISRIDEDPEMIIENQLIHQTVVDSRKSALEENALSLLRRLQDFYKTVDVAARVSEYPSFRDSELEEDSDEDNGSAKLHWAEPVEYGRSRMSPAAEAPKTRYERLIPSKPVIFKDGDLPGSTAPMRRSPFPEEDDSISFHRQSHRTIRDNYDKDDDDDVGLLSRWRPANYVHSTRFLPPPKTNESTHTKSLLHTADRDDLAQRVPFSHDPFSFHETYLRVKRREKRLNVNGSLRSSTESSVSAAGPRVSSRKAPRLTHSDKTPHSPKIVETVAKEHQVAATEDVKHSSRRSSISSASSQLNSRTSMDRPTVDVDASSRIHTHEARSNSPNRSQSAHSRSSSVHDEESSSPSPLASGRYRRKDDTEELVSQISVASNSGRLSPPALERRLLAELHYNESLDAAFDQIGETERVRALSLAHHETVSLAQLLQNQQLEKGRELEAALLAAQREHQRLFGQKLDEIRKRTEEATRHYIQTLQLGKGVKESVPVSDSSSVTVSSSTAPPPKSTVKVGGAENKPAVHRGRHSSEEESSERTVTADDGTLNVDTELDFDHRDGSSRTQPPHQPRRPADRQASLTSSIEEDVQTMNDESELHTASVTEDIVSLSTKDEEDDDKSSFREILPSEEHLRRHQKHTPKKAEKVSAGKRDHSRQHAKDSGQTKNKRARGDEEDFDTFTEEVFDQLKHDKAARQKHEAELERIKRQSKDTTRPEDRKWKARNKLPTKSSTAASEKYPEAMKSPRGPVAKSEEDDDTSAKKDDMFQKMLLRVGLDEKVLTRREKELHSRRQKAMLMWKRKLDEEEKKVVGLEKALQASKSAKSSGGGRVSQLSITEEISEGSDRGRSITSALPTTRTTSRSSTIPEEVSGSVRTATALDTPRSISEEVASYGSDKFSSSVDESSSISTAISGDQTQKTQSTRSASSKPATSRTLGEESQMSETVSDITEIEAHVRTMREELRRKKQQLREEKKKVKATLKREKDALAQQLNYYDKKIASLHKESKEEKPVKAAPAKAKVTSPREDSSSTSSSSKKSASEHTSHSEIHTYGSEHFDATEESSTLSESRTASSTTGVPRKESVASTVASEIVEEVDDLAVEEGQTPRSARKLTFSDINEEYSASDHDDSISKRVQQLRESKDSVASVKTVTPPASKISSSSSSSEDEDDDTSLSTPRDASHKKFSGEGEKPPQLNLGKLVADTEILPPGDTAGGGFEQKALLSSRTIHSEMSDIPEDLDVLSVSSHEEEKSKSQSDKSPVVISDHEIPPATITPAPGSVVEDDDTPTLPLYSEDFSVSIKAPTPASQIKSASKDDEPLKHIEESSDRVSHVVSYILSDEDEDDEEEEARTPVKATPTSPKITPRSPEKSSSKTESVSASGDIVELVSESVSSPEAKSSMDAQAANLFEELWKQCIDDCLSVVTAVEEKRTKQALLTEKHGTQRIVHTVMQDLTEPVKRSHSPHSPVLEGEQQPSLDLDSVGMATPSPGALGAGDSANKSPVAMENYLEDFLLQRQRNRALQFVTDNRAYCETLEVFQESRVNHLLSEAVSFLWESVGRCVPQLQELTTSNCAQLWSQPPPQFVALPSTETNEEMAQRLYPQGLRSSSVVARRAVFDMAVEQFCRIYQLPLPQNGVFQSGALPVPMEPMVVVPTSAPSEEKLLRQHLYPVTYPTAERQMFCLWRGTKPPNSLDALQSIVLAEIGPILRQTSTRPQLSRVAQWTVANKQDPIDRLLVEDLRRDESAWTTYDRDELRVKVVLADAIFKWMIGDFVAEVFEQGDPERKNTVSEGETDKPLS